MRAATFTGFGGPDDIAVQEFPAPVPDINEAVVRVEACSINRHDLWILEGDSAMVSTDNLPFITGLDVAGVVESVGEDVDHLDEGDRVVLCPNETCGTCQYCREGPEQLCEEFGLYHGGLAEQALVDADRLLKLPDDIDTTTAAALPTAYMTARRMLDRAEVASGDLVFVPGATGGVGVATIQLINAMGARSIGTSTSATKLDHLDDIGVDHAIQSADPDEIRDTVAEIGDVDAVINHLGGEYTQVGLDVLRRGGRMVICGRTAGGTSEIDIPDLFLQHKRVIGSTMGTQRDLAQLLTMVADGQFDPVVDETYALTDTDQAFADMQEREAVGKLVVEPQR